MLERMECKEIFNIYYALGDDRSLVKLREKLKSPESPHKVPSLKTLKRWSKIFGWQKQIINRDVSIMREIEKKIGKAIIGEKLGYHKDIVDNITMLKTLTKKAILKIEEGNLSIDNMTELSKAMNSYIGLIRLDLFLLGEPEKILLKFKGDITISDKDKEIALLSDEKLDEYIDTLSEGTEVPLLSGKEEKRDTE